MISYWLGENGGKEHEFEKELKHLENIKRGNKPFYLLEWKQIGRILLGSPDWHEYSGQNRAIQYSQLYTYWDGQKPITGRYLRISVSGSGFESVPPLYSNEVSNSELACRHSSWVASLIAPARVSVPPQPEPQYRISDHRTWGLRFFPIGVGHGAKAHVIIRCNEAWV